MSDEEYMLTTVDNPYNPFNQFDEWYEFDVLKGYNTCAYLARIANTSYSLSEDLNNKEIDMAIDEIIKYNGKMYKKVKKDEIIKPIEMEKLLQN